MNCLLFFKFNLLNIGNFLTKQLQSSMRYPLYTNIVKFTTNTGSDTNQFFLAHQASTPAPNFLSYYKTDQYS